MLSFHHLLQPSMNVRLLFASLAAALVLSASWFISSTNAASSYRVVALSGQRMPERLTELRFLQTNFSAMYPLTTQATRNS